MSPIAGGFFGPAWQTLGLVGPAPSIYALQGSLFCFSVTLSPSSLRRMFSRVPWVIIKQLPLGPLLEGLGWKFLRQGNFFNKALCLWSPPFFSSFLPSQNILPSHLPSTGPRPISTGNSPPTLLRILQPQTQVRSGTEVELGVGSSLPGILHTCTASPAHPLHLSLHVFPVEGDPEEVCM